VLSHGEFEGTAHRGEHKKAHKVLVQKHKGRSLAIPRWLRVYNVKIIGLKEVRWKCMDAVPLARNVDWWWVLVNTAMCFGFHKTVAIY
jgi:hypothetical protein